MDRTSEILWHVLEYIKTFPKETVTDTFPDINLITQNTINRHVFFFNSSYDTPFVKKSSNVEIVINSFCNYTYVDAILTCAEKIFKILADEAAREQSPIMYRLKHMIYSPLQVDNTWTEIHQMCVLIRDTYHRLLLELGLIKFNRTDRVLLFDEILVHHPVHAELMRQLFAKDQRLNEEFNNQLHCWN